MVKVITYTVRTGNAIPKLCDAPSDPSEGNIIFTFGTETQEVISCGFDINVVKSKDMCMFGGDYYSATYKALPGKVSGKLVFNSVLAKRPERTDTYPSCSSNGTGSIDPSAIEGDF